MSRELLGDAAPPMVNGELNFDAPWQGRVFAMANALCDAGVFEWQEFQQSLIEAVAGYDGQDTYAYYEYFQSALESLLNRKGVLTRTQIDDRSHAYSVRPHGHDHDHRH